MLQVRSFKRHVLQFEDGYLSVGGQDCYEDGAGILLTYRDPTENIEVQLSFNEARALVNLLQHRIASWENKNASGIA